MPGTATMHVAENGGAAVEVPLLELGGGDYRAVLAGGQCEDRLDLYFSAQLEGGATVTDPPSAPMATYHAFVAAGLATLLEEDFEGGTSAWSVLNDASLTSGTWTRAEPTGTFFAGALAAPRSTPRPKARCAS